MRYALILLLLFISIGCSDYGEDNTVYIPPGSGTPPNSATALPVLVGAWNKTCVSADTLGFRKSAITVSSPNTLQIQEFIFQNSASCEGAADIDTRANFTFTVPVFTPTQVNSIDMILQEVLAKITTANGVALANTSNLCGFMDWQIGVDKDISGRNCIVSLPNAGETFYQVFQVSSTELFVGKIDDARTGATPETRPIELEPEPYRR